MSFPDILRLAGKALATKDIVPILVGGWALNAHGIVRQTIDFDVMIADDDGPGFQAAIESVGYRKVFQNELFARYQATGGKTLPDIDCLFCPGETYAQIAAQGTRRDLAGLTLVIPVPRHLLAMKLHALKHGATSRNAKDFQDALELIRRDGVKVGSGEFSDFCLRFGNADILRRLRDADDLPR